MPRRRDHHRTFYRLLGHRGGKDEHEAEQQSEGEPTAAHPVRNCRRWGSRAKSEERTAKSGLQNFTATGSRCAGSVMSKNCFCWKLNIPATILLGKLWILVLKSRTTAL